MEKELLKPRLKDYLVAVGSYPDKKAGKDKYTCPLCNSGNNNTSDSDGAFHVTGEIWYCLSCHKGGDIFTLAGLKNNTTDFKEQMQAICKALNISDTETYDQKRTEKRTMKKDIPPQPEPQKIDYTEFLKACAANGADYFFQRGISEEVIKRQRLGTISAATLANYTASCKLSNGLRVSDAVIPYLDEQGNYIYFIARATNVEPNTKSQYPKFKKPQSEHAGSEPIYNYAALYQAQKPVFVCEGQIDALSILEVGGEAIALNGTGIDKLEPHLDKIKCPCLILALDNDEPGKKAITDMIAKLRSVKKRYVVYEHLAGVKDLNEALIRSREKLAGHVEYYNRNYGKRTDKKEKPDTKYPASTYVQSLLDLIKDKKHFKSTSTSFENLDKLLDGGLRAGLYFIGAVSGLGKTTLALQMADNIAASGQDVLFIALEMSRNELMAKSISRYTYEYATQQYPFEMFTTKKEPILNAAIISTHILQGKIREGIQSNALEYAANKYQSHEAQHLFIVEGIGNISVLDIKSFIEEHQRTYGTKPIVFIDYIQLLGTADETSDNGKAKIDKAVLDLKRLSRDYNVPVVCISSLNRTNYNEEINMAAFKESGSIEYTADVLIGMQYSHVAKVNEIVEETEAATKNKKAKARINANKETDMKKNNGEPIAVDLKILKNRSGNTGTVKLNFIPKFNYYEAAPEEEEQKEQPQIFKEEFTRNKKRTI